MTAIQVTTLSNDYIDVTVWREDDGRHCVETRRWPDGNANVENDDGDFPEPASSEISKHMSRAEAQKLAEAEYEGRDG